LLCRPLRACCILHPSRLSSSRLDLAHLPGIDSAHPLRFRVSWSVGSPRRLSVRAVPLRSTSTLSGPQRHHVNCSQLAIAGVIFLIFVQNTALKSNAMGTCGLIASTRSNNVAPDRCGRPEPESSPCRSRADVCDHIKLDGLGHDLSAYMRPSPPGIEIARFSQRAAASHCAPSPDPPQLCAIPSSGSCITRPVESPAPTMAMSSRSPRPRTPAEPRSPAAWLDWGRRYRTLWWLLQGRFLRVEVLHDIHGPRFVFTPHGAKSSFESLSEAGQIRGL
jgi:hypothetical protein